MRKLIAATAVLLFASSAAAVQLNSFETYRDGNQSSVFEPDDTVGFRLNVSDDQDYNVTLRSPTGNTVVESQPMQLTSSEYYRIYDYSHSLDNPEHGEWTAIVNMTISEETTLTTKKFYMASGTPGFHEVNPDKYVRVGETGRVRAKVADTGDDVQTVEILGEDQNYDMDVVRQEELYDVYEAEVNIDERMENRFTIRAEDSGGQSSENEFDIYGYSNDEESTSVDVNVSESCFVVNADFYAPKNGTMFIGETGYFTLELANRGSLAANISVQGLNVTYEGDYRWEEGDPVGESVANYTGENYSNVSSLDQVAYNRFFTKSNRSGWYSGHTKFNASCYDNGEKYNISSEEHVTFSVVNASGGVSEDGNESTNETIVSDVNHTSTEDTNETLQQEANQTGETGQNVEGDNDQAGVTPEPEPEPEPEPTPMLSLDMESVQDTYTGPRGSTIRANISISNEGNEQLSDLTVSPQLQQRDGWNANDAGVASLDVNESVYRELLIQTPASADSGLYVVPIVGSNPQRELDLDYFSVELTEEIENRSRMEVVEAPSSLNVRQNTTTDLPVLINNTGDTPLTNVSGSFQNMDQCGTAEVETLDRIPQNGSASLGISFEAAENTESCNTTLIVSSEEGSYSFSKVSFTVQPEQGLIPEQYRIPFIAFAWTGLLAAFALLRNRYHPNSALFKAPFVMIVAGEALIFLYLTADYYQLVQLAFLPF